MIDGLQSLLTKLLSGDLPLPSRGTFSVLPIPNYPKHYFGVADDGTPCLLLRSTPESSILVPPLRLQGFEVQYNLPCRVVLADGTTRDEPLTTVVCASRDSLERRFFLHAAEIMLRIIGQDPTLKSIRSSAEHLANIFQKLSRPPRKPLTGLLGELMLIVRSARIYDAVMAWRTAADNTFDFATGDLRIEVKATQGRARMHHLSYEQCHPPKGTTGVLASIIIEGAGGGTSLEELLKEIEIGLIGRHDAILRLHEIVAETLGHSLPAAMSERFDRQLAEQSFQLYDLREVPAIREPLPTAVSQVRFRSDLSRTPAADVAMLTRQCPPLRRLLPAKL